MQQKHVAEKQLVSGMVVSMFLWGLNWPSGKVLTHYCSVVNLMVYRFILVVAAMLILLPLLGINFRVKKKGIPVFIISGGLMALYSCFIFMGLKAGSAGAGGVLVTILNPVMAYILGIISNRRPPSASETAGLVLGILAGCILLKVWDNSNGLLHGGNLYFLLAAFIWAIMSKLTSKGAMYGSSMGFSLWQYIVTLFLLLPFTDFTEMKAVFHITNPTFWLNLFFSSVIVTSLATTVYFYTTTRIGAEKASSFIFLVPLAAAISSWLFLGEKILLHTAIGGILGIAAVYIMNSRKAPVTGVADGN